MRLHIVDGTYELFRAHFSKRPDRPLKATIGFASSMLALLEDPDEAVTHVAVAFDRPFTSIRNEWFDGYKTGEGVDPALVAQLEGVEEAARALGLVVWSMDRYEADDAMATAAARWGDAVEQVRLVTPDKDLGQALRGTRVVQVDRARRRVIDEAELIQLRGVAPASIPDWLALVGDAADGIPGIPGFGEKTAAALLRAFGHLEAVPPQGASWPREVRGAERLAATLGERRGEALLYRKLATLIADVPLREELEELAWRGVPRAEFRGWCERVEAGGIGERPTRWR